jgi:8-oxo-dGTP pyrophosphatase MutT (NUDIX family)
MPESPTCPTVDRLIASTLVFRGEAPAFVVERREAIAEHWSRSVAAKPALFDGTVLIAEGLVMAAGHLSATLRPIPFSAFLAWRDWGYPVPDLIHLSAAAAIVAADGAVLLGTMGAHTANAGRTYLVGGTPDLTDVGPDGRVDLVATAARELAEETGLSATAGAEALVVRDGPRAVVVAVHHFPLTTAELAAGIRRFLAADPEPELADVVAVRGAADLDHLSVPAATRAVVHRLLGS